MLQFGFMAPILALINGPIFSIVDKLIPDPDLKAKLKAEIRAKTLDHQSNIAAAQRDILMQELSDGPLFTRSWRPILMYVIILFLLIYGLFLPLLDLLVGFPVRFAPRWSEIPEGLWNLLGLGVGGYIGGRSLEKISANIRQKGSEERQNETNGWNRRNNLS